MRNFIKSLARDESGVTAVEYAILAGIVVAVLVGAASSFQSELTNLWNGITKGLTDVNAGNK